MKRIGLLGFALFAGCLNFDAKLDAGCEAGAAWCTDGGETPDAGAVSCTLPVDSA